MSGLLADRLNTQKVVFDVRYDGLFTFCGARFVAHVHRTAFAQVLQHTPGAERTKLLAAFEQAIAGTIAAHISTRPLGAVQRQLRPGTGVAVAPVKPPLSRPALPRHVMRGNRWGY